MPNFLVNFVKLYLIFSFLGVFFGVLTLFSQFYTDLGGVWIHNLETMNISIYIARKLSLASEGEGKRSPAVGVGITAVALSVLVMACAIAIVMGFKREITSKVAGFNSDMTITISSSDENTSAVNGEIPDRIVTLTPTLRKILDETPFIEDYALQASIPAILKTSDDFKGAYLKSLTGRNNITFVKEALISGRIPDYSNDSSKNDIVISDIIAKRLRLKTGDKIDTYFITDQLMARRLNIAGIYNSHFDTYDDTSVYGSLSLIQQLAGVGAGQGTSIPVAVDNFDKVEEYSQILRSRLVDEYASGRIYRIYDVQDARQSGAAYFHWLGMLDTNVIVVLTLMTIVAVVSIISAMFILMVDKVRVIALLAALGASRKLISRIFVRLSAKIAIPGIIIGDLLALGLLYAQQYTRFLPLDADSYYLDYVPVEISLPAILILNVAVLLLIQVSLILPSKVAGRTAPARTLAAE